VVDSPHPEPIPEAKWSDILDLKSRGIVDIEQIELAVGLPPRSLRDFLKAAAKARRLNACIVEDYEAQAMRFLEQWERQGADLEIELLGYIRNHACEKDWKAGAWMLEHLMPHKYSKQRVAMGGNTEAEVDFSKADRKALALAAHNSMDEAWDE
jgi:hypothetical protein